MNWGWTILLLVVVTVVNALAVAVQFLNMMVEELKSHLKAGSSALTARRSLRNALVIYRQYRAAVPGGKLHVQAAGAFLLGVVGSVAFVLWLRNMRSD